jgi:membrane associated rhomboid family serine protease
MMVRNLSCTPQDGSREDASLLFSNLDRGKYKDDGRKGEARPMRVSPYTLAGVVLLAFAIIALFSVNVQAALIACAAGLFLVILGQAAPKRRGRGRRAARRARSLGR